MKKAPDTPNIDHLERLAQSMDSKWTLPGTQIQLGWDTLIGLIPGIGDTLTAGISAYIVREAHKMGAPGWIKFRMVMNILLDWLIGTIPLLGDIFDVGWKANLRNVALIKKHCQTPTDAPPQ